MHSHLQRPTEKIRAFRNTSKRWLVSVSMVSEGVDIKRLRALAYLPYALTELAFRQAIGRVVRTCGPEDDTRAYVLMPAFETFDAYARRVEDEMSPSARATDEAPRAKKCPKCGNDCMLGAKVCEQCGHEFPLAPERVRNCPDCGAINLAGAASCHACGASFQHGFRLSLDEALRDGAIVRGMDIGEDDVRAGEEIAPRVRGMILKSGDHRLVNMLQKLPDESWAKLKSIFEAT